MRTLVKSCQNMNSIVWSNCRGLIGKLSAFYLSVARGKKSFWAAVMGLFALYIALNWFILGVCEILHFFNVMVELKRSALYLLLSPFFVFVCYCIWQMAGTIDNKILKLLMKAVAIGYLYITMGSFVVSTGILEGTRHLEQMNTVVYPLKVQKSDTPLQSERFENTLY